MELTLPPRLSSSKVTGKHQITIPSEVRKKMQIPLGADVLFRVLNQYQIELTVLPPPLPAEALKGALKIAAEDKKHLNKNNLTAGFAAHVARNYTREQQ